MVWLSRQRRPETVSPMHRSFVFLVVSSLGRRFGSLTSGVAASLLFFFLLVVVLLLLGLVDLPLLLLLDGEVKAAVVVALAVVSDKSVPPELVDADGPADGDRVVDLVVVADPVADQAPHCLPGGVSAEAAHLLWLAA